MQMWPIDGRIAGRLGCIFLLFVAVSIFSFGTQAFAANIKMSGGMSMSYEKYNRQYEKDAQSVTSQAIGEAAVVVVPMVAKEDKYDRFRIAPLVEFSAVTDRDDMSLRYSPSFRYDIETYDHDVDHDFNASVKRTLTKDWRLLLMENYKLTDMVDDQYATGADTVVKLSDNGNRRKYWTNSVKLVSEYSYWEGSLFSLGYNYSILENMDVVDGDIYENYDRHEMQFSVSHRYNSLWKQIVSGGYVRGLYDVGGANDRAATNLSTDKDLNEYRVSTKLESSLIEHHPLSLGYSYFAVDYDSDDQNNGAIHDMTLGWQWLIAKDWTYSLGGGPTYVENEGQDATWGYNANTSLQYGFEGGSLALSATRGFERLNFTGTNENGLSEFWQSRIDFKYELFRDVAWRLFTAYRYEDQEMVTPSLQVPTDSGENVGISQGNIETDIFNRKRFSVGTGVGYRFWQLYTLALSYDYAVQDSEKVNDSYDEHRVLLTLSMHTDLFNW